jgi:flagellar hook-basal body complex protein FliE
MINNISLQQLASKKVVNPAGASQNGAVDVTKSFGQFLNEALNAVQEQKKIADELTQQFITGQISDVHSVTIAAEKASLALELTVAVRNKAIEAYQEIMRIQI